jgi:hypothetical protein
MWSFKIERNRHGNFHFSILDQKKKTTKTYAECTYFELLDLLSYTKLSYQSIGMILKKISGKPIPRKSAATLNLVRNTVFYDFHDSESGVFIRGNDTIILEHLTTMGWDLEEALQLIEEADRVSAMIDKRFDFDFGFKAMQ